MSLWTLDSGTVTLDSGVFTWDGFGPELTAARGNAGEMYASWERLRPRRRTAEDVERDRERFGITSPAMEVIEEVVTQSLDQAAVDERRYDEQLQAELESRRIAFDERYVTAFNAIRAKYVEEATLLLRHRQQDIAITMILAAAVS